jgi:hypothetical protein
MMLPMKLTQFTLRDLFWLVLVAALAVGWFLDNSRRRQREEYLTDRVNTLTRLVLTKPATLE